MTITATAFKHTERIPDRFTCTGQNIHPELHIDGVPENARSLVLIVDDPDAPGGTFVHWVLYNIPTATKVIGEGLVPIGTSEGTTSFGKPGYGGPCPPPGKAHRYFFKLYALDCSLSFSTKPNSKVLEQAMAGHILNNTHLVGLYSQEG